MNVPKIRFNRYKDSWNKKNIGDLCSIKKGNGLSKNDITPDGKECILYGELYTTYNEVIFDIKSKTNIESKSFVLSKKNDVIIPASGETPIDIAKASCIMKDGIILGGDLNIFTPHNLDGRFLSYQINGKRRLELANLSQGHSVVHLYGDKIKNVNINFPSLNEQKEIANMLQLIDKKIELQSKKIEDLKLYKLSLREKLFNMFETEEKTLSKILVKWNKKNKDNKYSYVESVSNRFGFIAQNEQFDDRNIASSNTNNYYIIEKGVFAYNPSRLNIGSLALKKDDKISLVSPLYECFTTNQNKDFLLEWFQSKEFKKGTFSKFEGGVRNTLNFSNLSTIKISLPNIESQNRIASILNRYNKLVELENKKLYLLQNLKKGFMQKMFV